MEEAKRARGWLGVGSTIPYAGVWQEVLAPNISMLSLSAAGKKLCCSFANRIFRIWRGIAFVEHRLA